MSAAKNSHNLTEPTLFVSEHHVPRGMERAIRRHALPQWIHRVVDYPGLLERCLTHARQLNLWFAA